MQLLTAKPGQAAFRPNESFPDPNAERPTPNALPNAPNAPKPQSLNAFPPRNFATWYTPNLNLKWSKLQSCGVETHIHTYIPNQTRPPATVTAAASPTARQNISQARKLLVTPPGDGRQGV